MKKLLIYIMLVSSLAANDTCDSVASFAETAMKLRQEGKVSYREALGRMELEDGANSDAVNVYSLTTHLIDMAYKRTRYASEAYQERSVRDFGDEVYRSCIRTR